MNKTIFESHHLLAIKIADLQNPEKILALFQTRDSKTVFPPPSKIFEKELIKNNFDLGTQTSLTLGKLNGAKKETIKEINKYKIRNESRFNFIHNTRDQPVEIPKFISYLITKKLKRFSFFKNIIQDDEDFTYFDKVLISEFNENNPWARHIVALNNNVKIRIGIEKLAENEAKYLLNKFKSA